MIDLFLRANSDGLGLHMQSSSDTQEEVDSRSVPISSSKSTLDLTPKLQLEQRMRAASRRTQLEQP